MTDTMSPPEPTQVHVVEPGEDPTPRPLTTDVGHSLYFADEMSGPMMKCTCGGWGAVLEDELPLVEIIKAAGDHAVGITLP